MANVTVSAHTMKSAAVILFCNFPKMTVTVNRAGKLSYIRDNGRMYRGDKSDCDIVVKISSYSVLPLNILAQCQS